MQERINRTFFSLIYWFYLLNYNKNVQVNPVISTKSWLQQFRDNTLLTCWLTLQVVSDQVLLGIERQFNMTSLLIHTAKFSVLSLLFIYPLLSSVLFTAIHERLQPSGNRTTFHGWNISTTSSIVLYEEDLTRLIFTLPSLLTILLYLPFNDGVGQKVSIVELWRAF